MLLMTLMTLLIFGCESSSFDLLVWFGICSPDFTSVPGRVSRTFRFGASPFEEILDPLESTDSARRLLPDGSGGGFDEGRKELRRKETSGVRVVGPFSTEEASSPSGSPPPRLLG